MARVMAVVFEQYGQLYYLDPGDEDYRVGDWVRYPTPDGPEVAQCVWAPEEAEGSFETLPKCAGAATEQDLRRDRENRERRGRIWTVARELIARQGLPMKVVGVDYIDRSTMYDRVIAIYYTAPHRVDFRVLLGELARALDSRIDLRQVGNRDAARLIGGLGMCGRELCCATFLDEIEPVSMRMARVQGLPPNPLQISGACGRLMCCLAYEHPLYVDFIQRAPAVGDHVETDGRRGVVTGHIVPEHAVSVRLTDGETLRCPLESVCSVERRRRVPAGLGKGVDE